jgi:hypothetical protein
MSFERCGRGTEWFGSRRAGCLFCRFVPFVPSVEPNRSSQVKQPDPHFDNCWLSTARALE